MSRPLAATVLAALGAFGLVAQVLLMREFLVVFFGNEMAIGLFYGAWLAWIAAGAAAWTFWQAEPAAAARRAPWVLLALPIMLGLEMLFLRTVRGWLPAPPSELVPLGQVALVALAGLAPVGLGIGLGFPLLCRAISAAPAGVGGLFAAEAVGALGGGLAVTYLALPALSPAATAVGAACLLFAVAAAVARWAGQPRLAGVAAVSVAGALAAAAFLPLQSALDRLRWQTLQPGLELVASADTPYENLAAGRRGEQLTVLGNGKLLEVFPARLEAARDAALMMSQHAGPSRLLLVGGSGGGLLRALLQYRAVVSVDVLEPDPGLLDFVRPLLPPEDRTALDDPRVRLRHVDGRAFLGSRPAPGPYDLVMVNLPDPGTAQLNRFYTREFLEGVSAALAPGGVVALQVTAAANYLGESVASYGASVYATLKSVFPCVALAVEERVRLFGSRDADAVVHDAESVAARLGRLERDGEGYAAGRLAPLYEPERVGFVRRAFEAAEAPVNEDFRPATYYLNLLLWSHFSASGAAEALGRLRRAGLPVFLLPLALLLAVRLVLAAAPGGRRENARFNASAAIGALGFGAMGGSLVTLLAYQCLHGSLYRQLGLLAALFMLGLAAGAALGSRLLERPPGADSLPFLTGDLRRLGLTTAAAGVYMLSLPLLLRLAGESGEWAFGLLLAASGALTGLAFPLAAGVRAGTGEEPARAAAVLDAADHVGAAAGGLAAATILVPILGLTGTCLLLAAVAGSAAALFLVPGRAGEGPAQVARRSFPWPGLSWVVAAAALAALGSGTVLRLDAPGFSDRLEPGALAALGGRQEYLRVETPFPHYRGANGSVVMATAPVDPGVRGYGGPLNLAIGIGPAGRLEGVRLLEHHETPSYLEGLDRFLDGLAGRELARELPFGLDRVDGMTGATITSKAALEALNAAGYRAGGELLRLEFARPPARARPWWSRLADSRAIGVALLFALATLTFLRGGRRARQVCLALGLVLLGWAWNLPFTLSDAGNLSAGRLPGVDEPARLVLVALVGLLSLGFGQVFCGYLCPFGALQEFLSAATWQTRVDRRLEQAARFLKYPLLALALSGFWLTGSGGWLQFEPMQTVFSGRMTRDLVLLTTAVLALSTVCFRFWCRYFCPTGALLSLANHLSWLGRWARPRAFAACDLGVRFEGDVDCLKCRRCTWQAPRPEPEPASGRPERLFATAVAATLALTLWVAASRVESAGAPVGGGARAIDLQRVKEGLSRGSLSPHEALYYRGWGMGDGEWGSGERVGPATVRPAP